MVPALAENSALDGHAPTKFCLGFNPVYLGNLRVKG